MLFTILTSSPCRKYLPGAYFAIRYAQIIKIISQKNGSMCDGIRKIVAKPIASPKSDRAKDFLSKILTH